MKDFDINKIGKDMPYEAPDDKFFELFTTEILAKVESQPQMKFSVQRILAPLCGVAAVAAIILAVTLSKDRSNVNWNEGDIIGANVDNSIDSYLSDLSDEELTYIAAESSYHDDFYLNLPTEL